MKRKNYWKASDRNLPELFEETFRKAVGDLTEGLNAVMMIVLTTAEYHHLSECVTLETDGSESILLILLYHRHWGVTSNILGCWQFEEMLNFLFYL